MSDRVRFPNFFTSCHALVLDLLAVAYWAHVLPIKYRHIQPQLPDGFEPVNENFAQIFTELGKLEWKDVGELAGVNLKHLFGDVAIVLFKRATRICAQIEDMIRNRSDLAAVKNAHTWEYFTKDIVALKIILDSRRAFIPAPILNEYLGRLEAIQNYTGHNADIEALCRKMRAMIKPKANQAPKVAPSPEVVAAMAQEAQHGRDMFARAADDETGRSA